MTTTAHRSAPGDNPAPAGRIAALDVLRGVAILGTLATNIWIFTDPAGLVGYLTGDTVGTAPPGWGALSVAAQQLANGKFLGLLTLMFGVGLEIQRRSAVRAGRAWPGGYPARAFLLFLDGLLHYLLVVEFDVLMGYAVTGVVVAYLLTTSERAQRGAMWAAAGVHLLLLSAVTALLAGAPLAPTRGPVTPNPYAEGSWWDLVLFRVDNAVLFRIEAVFILAMSVATFLLGARLLRAGVFEARGARLRRRLMLLGLGVALPLDLLLGTTGGVAGLVAARYGTAPVVALGLLALGTEMVGRTQRRGFLGRRLTEVGRTALSCYVLQNVLASALCYGWGLGLAARLSDEARVPATFAAYVVVVTAVLLAAHGWVRWFGRGPVEALWSASYRALVRGRKRPVTP